MEDAMSESAESWSDVFVSLQKRGLHDVAMLVADGAGGIWSAFGKLSWSQAAAIALVAQDAQRARHKVPEQVA